MENGLDDRSLLQILDGLVDLIEFVRLEESIEREAALLVERNQARDEEIGNRVTLNDAAYGAAQQETPDVDGHFGAKRRCADDPADTPEDDRVDGLAEGLRIA